mgnify:CR=1 FL=1
MPLLFSCYFYCFCCLVVVAIGIEGYCCRESFCSNPDLVTFTLDHIIIGDGDHEDEDDGQEAAQCQDQEDRVKDEVGDRMDPVQAVHIIFKLSISHCSAPPVRS